YLALEQYQPDPWDQSREERYPKTSGRQERLEEATGVPQAIASKGGRPNPS
ncbi:unnamed protein product, partial [marine sediment metagenome]